MSPAAPAGTAPARGRGADAAQLTRAWRAARWSEVPISLPPPEGPAAAAPRPQKAAPRRRTVPVLGGEATDRPLVVIGNGPSLEGFDFGRFAGHDTIGLNAAYRYWDEIGWYPTYYACLDTVVGLSHRAAIERLVANRQRYGIRRFFLRANLVDAMPMAEEQGDAVVEFESLRAGNPLLGTLPLTTGSHALLLGAAMGYRRIKIVGVDCRYVEILPEVEQLQGTELELRATPAANPNYFFAGYQQKGDRYNVPNPTPDLHLRAWRAAAKAVDGLGLSVVNCNPASALDCFPVMAWEDALAEDARHLSDTAIQGVPAVLETAALARLLGTRQGAQHAAFDICPPPAGGLGEAFRDGLGWSVYPFAPDADRPDALAAGPARPSAAAEPSPAEADITALAATIGARGLRQVELLRTGSASFGLAALRGMRWGNLRPEVVHAVAAEAGAAAPDWADIAAFLSAGGYAVYASEWAPPAEPGGAMSWRGVAPWPMQDAPPPGSLLAFRADPGLPALRMAFAAARTPWEAPAGPPAPAPAGPAAVAPPGAGPARPELTAEWSLLPGAPLQHGPLVAEVETDRGVALEFRDRLHVVSTRQAIALRPGGQVRVRHVGRLVRPHGNSTARSGFLLLARIFDAGGLLAPPHVIAVQPAGAAWRDGSWVVRMDEVLRRYPGATQLRVSVSCNWVDDKAAESSGDGVSQSLLLEVTEAEPGVARRR